VGKVEDQADSARRGQAKKGKKRGMGSLAGLEGGGTKMFHR